MISNFPSPGLAFGERKEAEEGDGGRGGRFFCRTTKKGNNERRQKQVSRLTSPFLPPVDTSGVGVEEGEGGSFRLPETGLKSIRACRR